MPHIHRQRLELPPLGIEPPPFQKTFQGGIVRIIRYCPVVFRARRHDIRIGEDVGAERDLHGRGRGYLRPVDPVGIVDVGNVAVYGIARNRVVGLVAALLQVLLGDEPGCVRPGQERDYPLLLRGLDVLVVGTAGQRHERSGYAYDK